MSIGNEVNTKRWRDVNSTKEQVASLLHNTMIIKMLMMENASLCVKLENTKASAWERFEEKEINLVNSAYHYNTSVMT